MSSESKCSIDKISKYLIDRFNATEINKEEFLRISEYIYENEIKNIKKILRINDTSIIKSLLSENEKSEIQITLEHLEKNNLIDIEAENESSLYMKDISTGKLIIIILESKDGINLSGFVMEGNGQLLFDYLTSLLDGPIEKNYNLVDDVIEEYKNFKGYGNYIK